MTTHSKEYWIKMAADAYEETAKTEALRPRRIRLAYEVVYKALMEEYATLVELSGVTGIFLDLYGIAYRLISKSAKK